MEGDVCGRGGKEVNLETGSGGASQLNGRLVLKSARRIGDRTRRF